MISTNQLIVNSLGRLRKHAAACELNKRVRNWVQRSKMVKVKGWAWKMTRIYPCRKLLKIEPLVKVDFLFSQWRLLDQLHLNLNSRFESGLRALGLTRKSPLFRQFQSIETKTAPQCMLGPVLSMLSPKVLIFLWISRKNGENLVLTVLYLESLSRQNPPLRFCSSSHNGRLVPRMRW